MNDIKDNFDKLLRAIRYLFKGGNLLYWGTFAVVLSILSIHALRQLEAAKRIFEAANVPMDCDPQASAACAAAWQNAGMYSSATVSLLLLAVLAGFVLFCKLFDNILRISEGLEEEPVPYMPVSLASAMLPFKFFIGVLIVAFVFALFFALLPVNRDTVKTIAFYCGVMLAPAMVMNLVGNNSIISMIRPSGWIQVMKNLGVINYLSIILMPYLLVVPGYVIDGILSLFSVGANVAVLFLTLFKSFAFALTYTYIGYFMRDDRPQGLSEAEQRVLYEADTYRMDEKEKKQFAQDLLAADVLMQEGGFTEAEALLLNYTSAYRDIGQYFPAYRALYEFYQVHHRHEELPGLEQRLIEAAVHGNERCYLCVRKAVENIALDDIARLPADWIKPLARMAGEHHDYNAVLALTRNFAQRHKGHKDILENYYFAARALDKTGNRDQALHLLAQLISHYPDHPKTAQIRHSYELLQKQANPKPEQGA